MQVQFTELTDSQWSLVSSFFSDRKRKYDLRIILNAIFWVVRVGGQWRNLESRYPKWQIVYYYFRIWSSNGIIEKVNQSLVELERQRQQKEAQPTANTIDSQSVKIAPMISEDKGIDGNKKVNGRKRHLITDTLGLIIAVMVHAANEHDGTAGCRFFERAVHKLKETKKIFADHVYGGAFRKVVTEHNIEVEIAARPESAKGFVPIAKRWVVERTFGWFNFFRRLSKDYERKVQNSESMILLAQIQILLCRLDKKVT
jgi:putative transposase